MPPQTPGLGSPLKRKGASLGGSAGDAKQSYGEYTNPYSAALPDYMGGVLMGLPLGSLASLMAGTHAVYGGGPLGKPQGRLPGMDEAQSKAVRQAHEKARALAALGISSTTPPEPGAYRVGKSASRVGGVVASAPAEQSTVGFTSGKARTDPSGGDTAGTK